MQHLPFRLRGHDELDDHDHVGDKEAEHATDEETDSSETSEFDLALKCDVLGDIEGQGGEMGTLGLTENVAMILSPAENA